MSDTLEVFPDLARAYRADPMVTSYAFWDNNAHLEGNPLLWEDPDAALKRMGSAMAYFTGVLGLGHLYEADRQHPPDLNVVIYDVPEGAAPLAVRESVVGVRAVGRSSMQTVEGQVRLHPTDFLMALHDGGLVSEATWYREHMNKALERGQQVEAWSFNKAEVEVTDRTRRALPSWDSFVTPYNLSVLRVFEPSFQSLVPSFLGVVGLNDAAHAQEQEKALAALQAQADQQYDGHIAYAIQSLIWSRLGILFKNVQNEILKGYEWTVAEGKQYDFDDEGNPIYGRLRGTVVLDIKKNIDRRNEPEYQGEFLPLPAEEAARRLQLKQVRVPSLAQLRSTQPEDYWTWHKNRTWLGL